jgi:hypothetical protein
VYSRQLDHELTRWAEHNRVDERLFEGGGILNDTQPRYAAEWTPIMLSIEKSDRGRVLAGSRDRAASASGRGAAESQSHRPPCMHSTSP